MGDPEDLTNECGLVDKPLQKHMEHKGYTDQHFWYACQEFENYGGAINQERLVAIWGA
jgi:hypothetical protein